VTRDWTTFELRNSSHRDPAGDTAGTILVRFKPMTLPVPKNVRHLTVSDLTDPRNYVRTYERITKLIKRPARAEHEPLPADQQAVAVVREAVSGVLAEQIGPMLRVHTEQIMRSQRMAVGQIGDQVNSGIWELGDQLDERARNTFSQLDERLAVLLRALDDEANDGPRLFGLEPLDQSLRHPGLTTYRMQLTLWCEHSRIPVRLLEPDRPDAGVYTVEIPRDWWTKAAPLIRTTSTLLKALLPIGLPVIKANLDDNQWKSVEEQYSLGKETLGAAATLGAQLDDLSADDFDRTTSAEQPIPAEGGLLRMLHATLRKQDITYADLRKVRGEGHRVLWVHPRFEHIYNPEPPHIPT
jgi:hypothetical protein